MYEYLAISIQSIDQPRVRNVLNGHAERGWRVTSTHLQDYELFVLLERKKEAGGYDRG